LKPRSKNIEYQKAKRILARAKEVGDSVYAFKFTKSTGQVEIKTIPAGERAERMVIDFPKLFIGVYSPDCHFEWIFEDLQHVLG